MLRMLVLAGALVSLAAAFQSTILEETAPPGANYDKAEFRLWRPSGEGPLRATIVLVPGSNGDGRPMADEPFWQNFATRHKLALIGCHFADKKHDQQFIEEYVNVSQGSGQALLNALESFARRSGHPELERTPLLLWGMSAGGQFNYEFAAWKPERVAAFVVNKGGIYYTALVSQAARKVPGILFTGGKDLEFRTSTIAGLFALNRRAGALWAIAEEPSAAHVVGRSRDVAAVLFEEVLALGPSKLLAERDGFRGDIKAKIFQPAADAPAPDYPTSWLPTLRIARAWQALVTEKPFDSTELGP